jgi:nucleolin
MSSKKSVSWPDFLKLKFTEMKKDKPEIKFKDVLQNAAVKTEWKEITDGKHSEYTQGKAAPRKAKTKSASASSTKTKKNKKEKSMKMTRKKGISKKAMAAELMKECDICSECMKKIKKYVDEETDSSSSESESEEEEEKEKMDEEASDEKEKSQRGGTCPCVTGGGRKKKGKKGSKKGSKRRRS